jgi:hypothetical protein
LERQYARPQVASVTLDRDWNPAIFLIAIVIGVIVGVGIGMKDQLSRRGLGLDESYLVLASTLYGQDPTPAVAAGIRQKLTALNFANPAQQVASLGDRFARTRDFQRQREAEGLKVLGGALSAPMDPALDGQSLALADAAVSPIPASSTPQPTPAGTPSAAVAPAVNSAVAPTPVPTIALAPEATALPTMPVPSFAVTATPAATSISASTTGNAVARTSDNKGITVRKEASSKSTRLGAIPSGTRIQVLQTVKGEAVEGGDTRWYQVKYGNLTGYAYGKYVVVSN